MEPKSGFTLIEMSVVLVIIGLIVGGILTGQNMIRAAEIRATLSQLEKYNTATRTFQNKYGGLPGDISYNMANNFGLYYKVNAGNIISGNGDGIIEAELSGLWPQCMAGEVAMFFLHLSQAGLIDGMYGAGGADATISGATVTGGTGNSEVTVDAIGSVVNEIIPPAKLGRGNSFVAVSDNSQNYFILSGINKGSKNFKSAQR